MQAPATTTPLPADFSATATPITLPSGTAERARTVPPETAAAVFAPEIAVLQRCATWKQIVVEDESSFDSI